jgi:amino acid transporter
MGWDNASTIATEVRDPRRTYPRAMLLSAALVALTYVLPLAAVKVAGISVDQFTTGSWTDAARTLAGPLLGAAIVIGGMVCGFGMFNALVLSYTRLPVALAEDSMLPHWFAARNRHGAPWVSVLICGLAWALALRFTFERLISIDLILYGSSLILEFVALIVLRFREPGLPRPFRAGSLAATFALGAGPTVLIFFAMFAAHQERMAHMPALVFGLLVAAAGPVLYLISRKVWSRPSLPTADGLEAPGD